MSDSRNSGSEFQCLLTRKQKTKGFNCVTRGDPHCEAQDLGNR